MLKVLHGTVSATAILAAAFAMPAHAGQIFLTGHDDDFHQSTNAKAAMLGALAFVKAGSTLPVLTFDAGSELTGFLTSLGVAFTNYNPGTAGAIPTSLFDHTVYSAFVVASVTSCGGCDNTPAEIAKLTADSTAIAAFFNAGGGIIGLAGANDSAAYAYVPDAASNPGGSPPRSGYSTTACGVADGIPAVNGDTTHNFFSEPGTGGLSSAYCVTEINGPGATPESVATTGTIVCTGGSCTITHPGGGSVPEPGTLAMFGTGLLGLGWMYRRRQQRG